MHSYSTLFTVSELHYKHTAEQWRVVFVKLL